MSVIAVTAVVVAYDNGEELSDCVSALLRARYRHLDILLVDNASSDPEPARRAAALSRRIELLRVERNLGFAGAVNLALSRSLARASVPQVHALVNPDCVAHDGWLGPLVVALSSAAGIAIAGCRLLEADGRTIQHAGAVIAPNGLTKHLGRGCRDPRAFREAMDCDYVTGALCAFRTDVWRSIGPMDASYFPAYFEEADLCVRARRAGLRVVYLPESEGIHLECRTLGRGTRPQLEVYHRNRLRFLRRNARGPACRLRALRSEIGWLAGGAGRAQLGPLVRAYVGLARDILAAPGPPQ
jgi:GT2 family glycosyltransferase